MGGRLTRRGNIQDPAYMREVEKSEISHTNAIIQTDKRGSSLQPKTRPAFGATLWLNWQAAIGHFTRFFLPSHACGFVGTIGKLGSAR